MKKHFLTRTWFSLVAVLLGSLLLAACAASPAPAPAVQAEQPEISSAAPAETEARVLPTPRADLAATDPEGVVLAAGKPQLVEFFAFW